MNETLDVRRWLCTFCGAPAEWALHTTHGEVTFGGRTIYYCTWHRAVRAGGWTALTYLVGYEPEA